MYDYIYDCLLDYLDLNSKIARMVLKYHSDPPCFKSYNHKTLMLRNAHILINTIKNLIIAYEIRDQDSLLQAAPIFVEEENKHNYSGYINITPLLDDSLTEYQKDFCKLYPSSGLCSVKHYIEILKSRGYKVTPP